MASASDMIFVILASQVLTGFAVTCPLKLDETLGCSATIGCGCSQMAYDNVAAGTTKCSSAGAANNPRCFDTCCKAKTAATCLSTHQANKTFCGTGKRTSLSTILNVAGATSAEALTNCCETIPTVTCAGVNCAAGGTPLMIKKAGVAATTSVTDEAKCTTTCCETDQKTCGGVSTAPSCGTGKVAKNFKTTGAWNAAAAVKFTDNATFITNCCEAKGKCAALTCPSYMTAKATLPTECAGATCLASECCDTNSDSCVLKPKACTSANTTFDATKAMVKKWLPNATASEIQTACCVPKPAVEAATIPTCTDFWGAVTAAKAATPAKDGVATSEAGGNAASLAMLTVAGLAALGA